MLCLKKHIGVERNKKYKEKCRKMMRRKSM